MHTGMLGDEGTLHRLFSGLLLSLAIRLNRGEEPELENDLSRYLNGELILVPLPLPDPTKGVVKTVAIKIGGGKATDHIRGRTTDQIIKDISETTDIAHPDINQMNMPSGYSHEHTVILEFFEFDHDPFTFEVRARCEEPGYGYPTYEDCFRFCEVDSNAQNERPKVFVTETPWCNKDNEPQALVTRSRNANFQKRTIELEKCYMRYKWPKRYIFARRKYTI